MATSKTAPTLSGGRHPSGGNAARPSADATGYNQRLTKREAEHRGHQQGSTAPPGPKTPVAGDASPPVADNATARHAVRTASGKGD